MISKKIAWTRNPKVNEVTVGPGWRVCWRLRGLPRRLFHSLQPLSALSFLYWAFVCFLHGHLIWFLLIRFESPPSTPLIECLGKVPETGSLPSFVLSISFRGCMNFWLWIENFMFIYLIRNMFTKDPHLFFYHEKLSSCKSVWKSFQ